MPSCLGLLRCAPGAASGARGRRSSLSDRKRTVHARRLAGIQAIACVRAALRPSRAPRSPRSFFALSSALPWHPPCPVIRAMEVRQVSLLCPAQVGRNLPTRPTSGLCGVALARSAADGARGSRRQASRCRPPKRLLATSRTRPRGGTLAISPRARRTRQSRRWSSTRMPPSSTTKRPPRGPVGVPRAKPGV
jgi:hypothetical protein